MFGLNKKIERHMFYRGLTGFTAVMLFMTLVLWITEATQKIDLVTAKGQTLQLFLIMSCLAVPNIFVTLAPVALLIATIYVLHTMHKDTELVIIANAGGSPKRITRPLLWLGFFIFALVGFMSIYAAPASLQKLRGFVTQVRADLISTIMTPGAFTHVDKGLMVHIKQRNADGQLSDILISDTRSPDASFRYLAQNGAIIETGPNIYLILQNGHILRHETKTDNASIIEFASYAFDLSQFKEFNKQNYFRIKELDTWNLLNTQQNDGQATAANLKISAELHRRISIPLYAIAFPMLALLFMANPQTARSARGISIVTVIAVSIILRSIGFATESIAETTAFGIPFLYLIPLGSIFMCVVLLWANTPLDFAQRIADKLSNTLIAIKNSPAADIFKNKTA